MSLDEEKGRVFFFVFFTDISTVLKIYNWIKSLFQPVIMCIVIVERRFFFFSLIPKSISQELKYIG